MLTDNDILEIQNIVHSCNSNEELQEKLKMYFLVNVENLKGADPTRLAWIVYQNIVQNKSLK